MATKKIDLLKIVESIIKDLNVNLEEVINRIQNKYTRHLEIPTHPSKRAYAFN